jgi:hypothetical protein
MDTINYNIIDNIPKKYINKDNNIDTIKINEMIVGYETVQNTSDLDSTNKYNLEVNQEHIPIVIKNNNDNNIKKNGYIAMVDDGKSNSIPVQKPIPISTTNTTNTNKMSTFTSFYVGSLTIVGLFIVYRLIQKTK